MCLLILEIYQRKKEIHLDEEYYEINTKYNRDVTICEYIDDDNKKIFSGTVHPKKIKKYFYHYYKNDKNIRLPCRSLKNYWDSLFIEPSLKYKILDYALLLKRLERKKIDFIKLGINRSILIKGVPGTGKSTLARAVAQKIAIRTGPHFLFEINCSDLFSKFFGESAAKISSIFKEIKSKKSIVIIDEIETILISREKSLSSNDPIDSIRAVNSFLLNIDRLRMNKNIIFLFTSNFSEYLDDAFLSRMDLTITLSHLEGKMLYDFLKNFIEELMKKNIIKYEKIPDYEFDRIENKQYLFNIFKKFENMSPRQIKKTFLKILLEHPKNLKEILLKIV